MSRTPSTKRNEKKNDRENADNVVKREERRQAKENTPRQVGTLIQLRKQQKAPAFEEEPPHEPKQTKFTKYHWHMVLNHASPAALTMLARNPHIRIPELDSITTTENITCRACMERKLARETHKRKVRTFTRGEVFSSDIMGPINIPGVQQDTKRYFISFIDTPTTYAYVTTITSRRQAAQTIELFLNKIQENTGIKPK